jgi:hypothetical protein
MCYDTQKNSQDDIIIDFNKYDIINIDYKIQKKTDFYNGDFLENDLFNTKKTHSLDNTFIKENTNLNNDDIYENNLFNTKKTHSLDNTFIKENTNLNNDDIYENNLFNIHNENSYDDCKSTDDNNDIDDKYEKI